MDQLIPIMKFYIEEFEKLQASGGDHWSVLKYSAALDSFIGSYNRLVKEGIPAIESLPEEDKRKYWEIAGIYHSDKDKRIKAAKVAYVIELITK